MLRPFTSSLNKKQGELAGIVGSLSFRKEVIIGFAKKIVSVCIRRDILRARGIDSLYDLILFTN